MKPRLAPLRRFLAVVALACALPLAAPATVMIYTDFATFMAALNGAPITTQTFDTAQTFVLGDNAYNGMTFRVTGTTVGGNSVSGGILNGDEFTNTSVDYLFGAPITAIGATFNGARTANGINWVVDGNVVSIFSASPGTGFFGIISTVPFSFVDVNGGATPNEIYSLDNLVYANNAVPEPGTLGLLAVGGLAGWRLVRRRR